MQDLIDLDLYPLDRPQSAGWCDLVARARAALDRAGLFDLPGFLRPAALRALCEGLAPRLETDAFRHARWHNIYFQDQVAGLAPSHPALRRMETVNHTLCLDQLEDTGLAALYRWGPFAGFLAAVTGREALFPMADPLAGVNVMGYHDGEALNWHFDRAEFTTTLLLQAPEDGGVFEYARDLRRDDDPNHKGVAALLTGGHAPSVHAPAPGTLTVFLGRNTAHRVSPVIGPVPRIVAVFSYFDRPGVTFTAAEQRGFYGRSAGHGG